MGRRGRDGDCQSERSLKSTVVRRPQFHSLVVTLFWQRGQMLANEEFRLHPFGVGRPFGPAVPGDLQN